MRLSPYGLRKITMTAVAGEYAAAFLWIYIVGYTDLRKLSACDSWIEKIDKA